MNNQKRDLIAIVLIFLAVFSVYLNTLPNEFMFDDKHMIVGNSYIKNLKSIPLFFKGEITSLPIGKGMYRPILMLTFAFNYLTGGLKPYGYHIINILIHFLNACLLYFFLRLFLKNLSYVFRLGIVLIFCLHPVNTEAVTYISSRSDLLCSFFILLGLYTYIRSQDFKKSRLYLLSLVLYILALLTKEVGLVLVGLIVAYEIIYTKVSSKRLKGVILNLLPFVLITVGYLLLRKFLFGTIQGTEVTYITPRPLWANILTQAAVSFYYLYLFFFPFNLCIDHNFPIISTFTNPLGSISLILILVLVIACLLLRKRLVPVISFACLWYFISLSPKFYARLNLVCAEHQAYLAFFSLYFLLGFLFTKWRIKRVYLRQLFFFILGLFFLLTLIRNFQWQNGYTLWKATLKVNPYSGIAQGNLGIYLGSKGHFGEAKEYIKQAANSAPIEITRVTSILNLAYNYALLGEPEKGLEILRQEGDYIQRVPGYYKTLGFIYLGMGKKEEARKIWERSLQIYSKNPELKAIVGWWYLENSSDKDKAKEYFEAAVQENPDLALSHLGLGMVLEQENDLQPAIEEYERVIRLLPEEYKAYYRLGLIYAQKLLDTRAEWYFKKTIELSPNFAPVYYNLCIFYLSLPEPDYKLALEHFNKAKALGYKVDKDIEDILSNR